MCGFDSSVAMDLIDWENGDDVDNEERVDARRRVLLHNILPFRCDTVVPSEDARMRLKRAGKGCAVILGGIGIAYPRKEISSQPLPPCLEL
jgi:hypothetical protein